MREWPKIIRLSLIPGQYSNGRIESHLPRPNGSLLLFVTMLPKGTAIISIERGFFKRNVCKLYFRASYVMLTDLEKAVSLAVKHLQGLPDNDYLRGQWLLSNTKCLPMKTAIAMQ